MWVRQISKWFSARVSYSKILLFRVNTRFGKNTVSNPRVGNGTGDLSNFVCQLGFVLSVSTLQVRGNAPKVPTIAIEYVPVVSKSSEKNMRSLSRLCLTRNRGTWSGD